MPDFQLEADFSMVPPQAEAARRLVDGFEKQRKHQVLLGITGSGKTYVMANVIQRLQRPTLVIAPNKTLAGQLYQEFKAFFPRNAVEYFVSFTTTTSPKPTCRARTSISKRTPPSTTSWTGCGYPPPTPCSSMRM